MIYQRLADANPTATTFRRDLAVNFNNIGLIQSAIGRNAHALRSFERAGPLPGIDRREPVHSSIPRRSGRLFAQNRLPANPRRPPRRSASVVQPGTGSLPRWPTPNRLSPNTRMASPRASIIEVNCSMKADKPARRCSPANNHSRSGCGWPRPTRRLRPFRAAWPRATARSPRYSARRKPRRGVSGERAGSDHLPEACRR